VTLDAGGQACRLALGTVQFGLDYGVANRTGKVSSTEIRAILETARNAGLQTIDTAIAYGDSEQRLGEAGIDQFDVVSKLPAGIAADAVAAMVESSLAHLRVDRLGGLLLHRSGDLIGPDGAALYKALQHLKADGRVGRIGVSIYAPSELDVLMEHAELDLVQAPYNVIDRRLDTSGWLDRLCEANVEVHTRSAFLQGLLLMPPQERPPSFLPWNGTLSAWDRWLVEIDQTAIGAALNFAVHDARISRVLVGIDDNTQLLQILAALDLPYFAAPEFLASDDPALVNPSNWVRT